MVSFHPPILVNIGVYQISLKIFSARKILLTASTGTLLPINAIPLSKISFAIVWNRVPFSCVLVVTVEEKKGMWQACWALLWLSVVATVWAAEHDQEFLGNHDLGADVRRPNVVFILTDDQDVHLSSLDYMPLVRKHLIEKGTLFNSHYCTTAVCCPSRVTLWTGKAAHNTNVTDVNPPYGK